MSVATEPPRAPRWAGAHAVLARLRVDAARREAAARRRGRPEPTATTRSPATA